MASSALSLPVSGTPEPDPSDSSEVRCSVAQSRVVLLSLKQCLFDETHVEARERWLSVFPQFSSKSRSKKPGIVPAPHTSKRHGTCDIYIGPHMFCNTSIFEIHYTIPPVQAAAYRPPSQYTTPQPWNGATSYSYQYAPPPPSEPAGNPLVAITPELLSRVTRAGASNPTLANLLQLAASGYASQEQLRTLGLLIQSLAASPDEDYPLPSSSSPYSAVPNRPQTGYSSPAPSSSSSTKPPDLVLEFPEKHTMQFVFPRGVVYCERVASTTHTSRHDILLSTVLYTDSSPGPGLSFSEPEPNNSSSPSQVVTFRFANAPAPLWDFVQTWTGGPSAMEANKKILEEKCNKQPPRVYLQHRLPEGPLLSQIHNAAPLFATRLIKPSRSDTAKRKRSKPSAPRKKSSNEAASSLVQSPAKRKKASVQPEQHGFVMDLSAPVKITCHGCGQADVPLLKGGRYCRSCLSVGETPADHTPQVQTTDYSNSSTSVPPSNVVKDDPLDHPESQQ